MRIGFVGLECCTTVNLRMYRIRTLRAEILPCRVRKNARVNLTLHRRRRTRTDKVNERPTRSYDCGRCKRLYRFGRLTDDTCTLSIETTQVRLIEMHSSGVCCGKATDKKTPATIITGI